MKTSNCCNASPKAYLGPHGTPDSDSEDYGVCSKCGEHCGYEEPGEFEFEESVRDLLSRVVDSYVKAGKEVKEKEGAEDSAYYYALGEALALSVVKVELEMILSNLERSRD